MYLRLAIGKGRTLVSSVCPSLGRTPLGGRKHDEQHSEAERTFSTCHNACQPHDRDLFQPAFDSPRNASSAPGTPAFLSVATMHRLWQPLGLPAGGLWAADQPQLLASGCALHTSMPVSLHQDRARQLANRLQELGLTEPAGVREAVKHHDTTGMLPDEAHLLAWMAGRALGMRRRETQRACLAKLCDMADDGQLTRQDLAVISLMPNDCWEVRELAPKVLPSLPQLEEALQPKADKQSLDQFVQLPHHLVVWWARMFVHGLPSGSENTVAVLFTALYDHQCSITQRTSNPPADQQQCSTTSVPTEQQCKQLSSRLRLHTLSPSFQRQVLPRLKWYRPADRLLDFPALARLEYYDTTAEPCALQDDDNDDEDLWDDEEDEDEDYDNGLPYNVALRFKVSWPAELLNHMGSDAPLPVTAVQARFTTDGLDGQSMGGTGPGANEEKGGEGSTSGRLPGPAEQTKQEAEDHVPNMYFKGGAGYCAFCQGEGVVVVGQDWSDRVIRTGDAFLTSEGLDHIMGMYGTGRPEDTSLLVVDFDV